MIYSYMRNLFKIYQLSPRENKEIIKRKVCRDSLKNQVKILKRIPIEKPEKISKRTR